MALHTVKSPPEVDLYGFDSYNKVDLPAYNVPYGSKYNCQFPLPRAEMPRQGAPAGTTAQLIQDELDLDAKPNLNLASFVGTYMEPEAEALFIKNLSKNMSDHHEYPSLMNIHGRCVSIIARLWNSSRDECPVGVATTGSSEAIHLGGLALKRRWQERCRAEGKPTTTPNIIMGSHAQVALLKFARYFEVEARVLPIDSSTGFCLDPASLEENVDENTIGVFAILGNTYTGHYDDVEKISQVLDKIQRDRGIDVPIHVDAASGGFIAPFSPNSPRWDFRLPRVKSINASGHKFGLVYAGLGWIIWRDEICLPKALVFELDYLGSVQQTFTLSFSRPGAQVIGQYYNFVRLGFTGFCSVVEGMLSNARLLSTQIEGTGWYTCISDIHRYEAMGRNAVTPFATNRYASGLPVLAFTFSPNFRRQFPRASLPAVSIGLQSKMFIAPCYKLPPSAGGEVIRVVVRESMSRGLMEELFRALCEVTVQMIRTLSYDHGRDEYSPNEKAESIRLQGNCNATESPDWCYVENLTEAEKL